MNPQNDVVEIDLKEIFHLIRRNLVIIVVIAIMAGGITAVVNKFLIKPMYASTAKIFILSKDTEISISDIQVSNSLTGDYMELIKSRPIVERVIQNQGLDETYESMVGKLSVNNPSNTRILTITIRYDEPNTAKAIADEFAEVAREGISQIMDMEKPNVLEQGYANPIKVSPNVKRNTLIATILAGFLMVGVIIFTYVMNDSIQSSEDVEKYLELNVLSVIPVAEDESDLGRKSRKKSKKSMKRGKKVSEK